MINWDLIFPLINDYTSKIDCIRGYQNPKRKLEVATQCSEIISFEI